MNNLYEMMVIKTPKLAETEEKKLLDKIDKILSDKGKIHKTSNFGKRALTYPIKKETEGNYWLLNLEIDPLFVTNFSNKIKMEDSILRYLILRLKEEINERSKEKITKIKEEKISKKVKAKRS